MKIGKNIKKLRELRDFSQQSLALELNISQKQLSRIENNEISPTIELDGRISECLKVSFQELLDFTESKIFNNITNNQKGKFVAYNNTEIKQVEELYKKLLEEKERTIQILQKQFK